MLIGLLRRDESLTDSGKERVVHSGPGGNMTPIVPGQAAQESGLRVGSALDYRTYENSHYKHVILP